MEVFTGDMPFKKSPDFVAMMKIINGERPGRPAHSNFTEPLWTLTQECWRQSPKDRPQVDHVIQQLSVIESADQVPQTTPTQSDTQVVAVAVPTSDDRLGEGDGYEAGNDIREHTSFAVFGLVLNLPFLVSDDKLPNGGESSNHSQTDPGLASWGGQSMRRDPLRDEHQNEEMVPQPPAQSLATIETRTESSGPLRGQPVNAPAG